MSEESAFQASEQQVERSYGGRPLGFLRKGKETPEWREDQQEAQWELKPGFVRLPAHCKDSGVRRLEAGGGVSLGSPKQPCAVMWLVLVQEH